MKKLLLLWLTKNVALSHSFKRLAFLAIALTLSFTASAQTQYCQQSITASGNTVLVSLTKPSTNVYQVKIESSSVMTSLFGNIWANNVNGAQAELSGTGVVSNGGLTIIMTINSTTQPSFYTSLYINMPSLITFAWPTNILWGTCAIITPPIVAATTTVTLIEPTTATSGGNVTSDSGNAVTARGVCWGTTSGPTTALATKTTNGTGTGSFTSSLTGLIGSTLYYVRAYATNGGGTTYGTEVSFTTTANPLPTLAATTAASAILITTATSGGNVTNEGTSAVTAKGVCWAITTAPTIALATKTNDGTGTGAFTSNLTGLTGSTLYYVRAYATNSSGTSYGTQVSFTTTSLQTPPTGPTAPPIRNNLNVLSQYGSAYTNQTGVIFDNFGGGATIVGDVTLDDNSVVKKYTNHSYSGISPNSSNNLNVSGMTHLHMDVWSPNFVSFKVKLEATNGSNNEIEVPFTKVQGVWNSYDIPLSTYVNTNLTILKWIVPVTFNPNNTTLFITNVYFYKQDTWSGTTTTNWATTTNWVSGAVPTSTSDVVIPSSVNQPIIGSDVSISSLTIKTLATLTVNAGFDLTVANAVANSGTMTLQNNANLLQSSATTTNSNSGNLIVKRNSASLLRLDHTLWSSPVVSQNIYGFSTATLTDRFYVYNTTTNAYTASGLSGTTTFAPGKGYGVRAPNNHSSTTPTIWEGTFTGIPNNGTVPFTLSTASSGYNLVGNPYPSPISATTFLSANPGTMDGTIYFYSHSLPMNADGTFPTGTNYSSWVGGTGTAATRAVSGVPHYALTPATPNGIIQVGQGFFVKATAAGTINFTNAMRVGNNDDQFLRTTEIERHRLWLNLTTESGDDINQIAVAYVEGATQNADTNFDGLSFGNTGSMLSSKIDGSDYVIQGRSLPFASNDMVPLGFKATATGNYKIVLTEKDGLFLGNQDVFVRDNLMGIEHNIKVSPYTFASEIGTFDARFQLVYTQTLGIPSTTFTPNAVIVYKNTDGFHVTTNGIVMKDILVYDISGRLIFKQSNINGTTTVLKGLLQTKQVLLLKITSQENETVTVKAIN